MIKLYDPSTASLFYSVVDLIGEYADIRDIDLAFSHIMRYASGVHAFDGYTIRWDEPDHTGMTPVYITV